MSLDFAPAHGRSVISSMQSRGPLRVLNLFYPEPSDEAPETCHCYLLHPPGGLVSGDSLSIDIRAQQGSRVLVTTPAATKIYHADSQGVVQRQEVVLKALDSDLEWFPQESILYSGSRPRLSLKVKLSAKASFLGSEMICFGRRACLEEYLEGDARQQVEIWREGEPLCFENLRLEGGSALLYEYTGMRSLNCIASVYAVASDSREGELEKAAAELKHTLSSLTLKLGGFAEVSFRQHLCAVKYLGESSRLAHLFILKTLKALRPAVSGRDFVTPRIWRS